MVTTLFSWEARPLQVRWRGVTRGLVRGFRAPGQLLISVESCGCPSPSFIKVTRPCVHDPDVAPAWGGLLVGGASCTLICDYRRGSRTLVRVPVGPSAAAWPREVAETQDVVAETRFHPGAVSGSWVSWGHWSLSPRVHGCRGTVGRAVSVRLLMFPGAFWSCAESGAPF